jgi:hypothetical protein
MRAEEQNDLISSLVDLINYCRSTAHITGDMALVECRVDSNKRATIGSSSMRGMFYANERWDESERQL